MNTHPARGIYKIFLAALVMLPLILCVFFILKGRLLLGDDLLLIKLDFYDWAVQTHTVTRTIEGCDCFSPSGNSTDFVRCALVPGLDFCARPQSYSLRISDVRGVILLEYAFVFSNTVATAKLPVKSRTDQWSCNTPIPASVGEDGVWRYSEEWSSEWKLLPERDKTLVYKCVKNRFGRAVFDKARKAYIHKIEGMNHNYCIYCFKSGDVWYVWGDFCVSITHKGELLGSNLSDEEIIAYVSDLRNGDK